jgi:type I restriction enzyme S subunit
MNKRNENRQGYKKTKVGWIPEEWVCTALKESKTKIIDGDRGNNYPKQNDFLDEGYCLFLNANNVTKNGFVFKNCQFISQEKDKRLRKGKLSVRDIVITTRGTVGNVAFYKTEAMPFRNIRINSGMAIIRPDEMEVTAEYLFLLFGSFVIHNQMKKLVFGSAQPQLTINLINNLSILFPSLAEQQKIAEILSTWDRAIEQTKKLIEVKQKLKKGLMQQLLTGRMRFPEFGKPTKTKGKLPKGWINIKLGEVSNIKTGNKDNKDKVENGKYPFFVRSEFVEKIDTYSFNGEAILIPGEGKIGDIFHYINGKFDFHQRVYKISNFSKDICGKYVYFFLWQNFKKQSLQGSVKATVDSLRLPTFTLMQIIIPAEIKEQEKVSGFMENYDQQIKLLDNKKTILLMQKQGLMQKLLTGEIRVKINKKPAQTAGSSPATLTPVKDGR